MDSETNKTLDTTKKYLTTAASIAASAMFARTIINEYLPNELRSMVSSGFDNIFSRFSTEHTIVIQETEGLSSNELYDASTTYLRTRISPSMKRLRASKHEDKNNIALSLDDGEELIDVYRSVEFRWLLISQQENQSGSRNQELSLSTEVRWLELSFHKKHKKIALDSYLPHILERSKEIKAADRRLKLFMNEYESWSSIDLHHPATFETLAMESELKRTIMEDLARFVKRKEYYKRIGKAWKRGYLLYGPPGTGKSSLIAAMANYLRFDIYDMDLKEVSMNSGLKRLLIGMANKSMLVIEDIDCSIDLQNRDDGEKKSDSNNEVTLSGLLNFIDGLWSTTGEERIIVFTTNYKDRLDPALLRPGRMDMHIHMGYCGPSSFRILASNYHAVDDHPMFAEIEGLLEEVKATPAEVAEQLMRSDDLDIAFGGLLQLLHRKRKEVDEAKKVDEIGGDEEQKGSESPAADGEAEAAIVGETQNVDREPSQ